jgi:hypothetical protein
MQDGKERKLSVTFHLTVAPLAVGDASFVKTRRPSLVGLGDNSNPRRFASDTVLPSLATRYVFPLLHIELLLICVP